MYRNPSISLATMAWGPDDDKLREVSAHGDSARGRSGIREQNEAERYSYVHVPKAASNCEKNSVNIADGLRVDEGKIAMRCTSGSRT